MASSARTRARSQADEGYRPQIGFADGLGVVVFLVLIGYFAAFRDPINLPRMAILWVGAAALLPFVVGRWRSMPDRRAVAIPAVAAAGLLAWGALSALLAGGPWGVGVYGWWGRSDGLLTLAGVVILLWGASTLDRRGIERLLLWLLVGLAAIALIGLGQWLGVISWGQGVGVDATLGNPNIAAGLCAVGAVLLGYSALDAQAVTWLRIARGIVAGLLAVVAVVNGSVQGPATIAFGCLLGLGFLGLGSDGRRRKALLSASGAGIALAGILAVLAIGGSGPLASIWAEPNTQIRVAAWGAGVDAMAGHPVFGTGPGGMERYFFEYVPADYVALVGPQVPVNALHNIGLQFGATLGIPGLVLWLVIFIGAAVLLGVAAWRHRVDAPLAATLGGGLAAYLVQGMVSIDMVALMALGWLLAGLCLAGSRDPRVESPAHARTPGTSISSAVLAIAAILVLLPQVQAIPPGGATLDSTSATSILRNPLTPCHIRVDIAGQASTQLPADVGPPAVFDAWRLDPRCLTMAHIAAQTAMAQGDLALAGEASAQAIAQDPTFVTSWTLRARYHALSGEVDAALADLARARQEQGLYPDPAAYESEIAELEQAIAGMR